MKLRTALIFIAFTQVGAIGSEKKNTLNAQETVCYMIVRKIEKQ
jgi:hypothetical protein